ncbi:DUF6817 domain-containing protein, partial [Streptomyces sp. NPDC001177]
MPDVLGPESLRRHHIGHQTRLAGLLVLAGNDGGLGDGGVVGEDAELRAVIGTEAEAIVYFYASCDRKATYPTLTD